MFSGLKRSIPALTLAGGSLIFVVGLMYGVITVGVPTPDAPPSVAMAEARNSAISDRCMLLGAVLGFAGGVWTAIVAFKRRNATGRATGE